MLNATKLAGKVGLVLEPTTHTILCYDVRLGNIYKGDKKKKYRGQGNKGHTYEIIPSWSIRNSVLKCCYQLIHMHCKKGLSGKITYVLVGLVCRE